MHSLILIHVLIFFLACKGPSSSSDQRSEDSSEQVSVEEANETLELNGNDPAPPVLNLTPPPQSPQDNHCTALNPSAADNSAQLQACIDATSSGGKVWLPAATYSLQEKVILSRGVNLVGINGVATLRPASHSASIRFPDLPNLSTLADVRVDFTAAKKTMVDILDYFAPKVPVLNQLPPHKMTTIVGPSHLYMVKGHQPNTFVLFVWDKKNLYLKIDQSQRPHGYSLAGGVWSTRFAKVGTTFNIKSNITYYEPNSCTKVASSPYSYSKILTSHEVRYMGGDIGWQDVISFAYRHGIPPNTTGCAGAVDEVFDYSSQWGNIQWRMICAKTGHVLKTNNTPQIAQGFNLDAQNTLGLGTNPNTSLLCTGAP